MAIIKFGGGVAGISGKIGGTVYARNKAGAYARNWAKPVNPVSSSQAAVRSLFGNASAAWGALTSTDRDAWNAAAALITRVNRFGEPYVPSGRQYFMETQNSLLQAGQAGTTAPPSSSAPPSGLTLGATTATASGGTLTALTQAFTDTLLETDVLVIEAAPPSPDTKTNVNTQYRQIAALLTPTSPMNLLSAYIAIFGDTAIAGDIIRLRISKLDSTTGLRSVPQLASDAV